MAQDCKHHHKASNAHTHATHLLLNTGLEVSTSQPASGHGRTLYVSVWSDVPDTNTCAMVVLNILLPYHQPCMSVRFLSYMDCPCLKAGVAVVGLARMVVLKGLLATLLMSMWSSTCMWDECKDEDQRVHIGPGCLSSVVCSQAAFALCQWLAACHATHLHIARIQLQPPILGFQHWSTIPLRFKVQGQLQYNSPARRAHPATATHLCHSAPTSYAG